MIDGAVAAQGREDAEDHADDHANQGGKGSQFNGGGQIGRQIFHHRTATLDRNSQIAAHEVLQIDEILFMDRAIQSPLCFKSRHNLGIGHSFLAEIGGNRVGRDSVRDGKRDERDPKEQRNGEGETA